jgi:hypothetical protein
MATRRLDFDMVTYDGYISTARDPRLKNTERAGAAPAPLAPSTSDVEYVNDLADDFGLDDADGPEWAIVAGAAIVGTGFVLALGALCIIGAVAVARWLGWVA